MDRYTLVGDPHLTHKSLDRGAQLFEVVEAIGLPCIWLGDFLDTKEVIRGKCLNALIGYLQTSKLQHYILIGNHDWFNLDCEAHSLEALKLLPNVKVIDAPEVIGKMLMVPYMHDRSKLEEVIARFQGLVPTMIAHLEITNFDFGNGHVCTAGLPLSALSGFKRVISGHFHKYQTDGNLTYLGTPFSHSFGEANQTKYLGMYDADSDDLKIAETPFSKHISIEFNCDLLNEHCEHMLFTPEPGYEKNFYRVILTGSQANIARFPRYMYDEGGTSGKLNIKWISRPSDYAENDVTIEDTFSNEQQFVKWATEIKTMDAETVKLGLAIMEACK